MALHVELLQYTKEPEKIISAAAKLCYSSSGVQDVLDGLDEALCLYLVAGLLLLVSRLVALVCAVSLTRCFR